MSPMNTAQEQGTTNKTTNHIQPNTPEWTAVWAQVASIFGDSACENNGEVWQYMGTWDGKHEFRHRDLGSAAGYHAGMSMNFDGGRVYYKFAPGTVGAIYH